LESLTSWIANSAANDLALALLGNVPGSPPILQTIHLLSIVAIMASALMIDLRILGLAIPSQEIQEMAQRLRYWTLVGVIGVFSSGVWFVLARPNRYFNNPVFQIKFALLVPALLCSYGIFRIAIRKPDFWATHPWRGKLLAAVSLLLWVGVVLAGRWIAYAEYLFWPA
jgi:hypothetical protein